MKFITNTSVLQKSIQVLNSLAQSNSHLPILENFLFVLENDKLIVTSTNLEVTMSREIQVLSEDSGRIAIPAKILLETLKHLPNQPLTFSINEEDFKLTILSTNAKYNISCEDGDDYPATPTMDKYDTLTLSFYLMQKALRTVSFAIGKNDFQPVMMGFCMNIKPKSGCIDFVATDSFNLGRFNIGNQQSCTAKYTEKTKFIFPKKVVELLNKMNPSGDIAINFADSYAELVFEDTTINARLIEGKFVNYESVIPVHNTKSLITNRKSLLSSLSRLHLYSNQTTHQVDLLCETGQVKLKSSNIDFSSEASEVIMATYDNSEKFEISFNAKSLAELLRSLESESIVFFFGEKTKPAIIKPYFDTNEEIGNETTLLLMPIIV